MKSVELKGAEKYKALLRLLERLECHLIYQVLFDGRQYVAIYPGKNPQETTTYELYATREVKGYLELSISNSRGVTSIKEDDLTRPLLDKILETMSAIRERQVTVDENEDEFKKIIL